MLLQEFFFFNLIYNIEIFFLQLYKIFLTHLINIKIKFIVLIISLLTVLKRIKMVCVYTSDYKFLFTLSYYFL